jgi:hypothetical protein
LAVVSFVVKTRSSPSTTNQIGTTIGPDPPPRASLPVRTPEARKARHSIGVRWRLI